MQYDDWRGIKDKHASGGSYRASSEANDTVTFKFAGGAVKWLTRKGPAQGIAQVTVDGVAKCNCDLYNATDVWKFGKTFSGLGGGAHTLVITVTGNKNASSSDTNIVVDAFTVGTTTTQDKSYKILYNGWQGVKAGAASGGSYRVNGSAGGIASLNFVGSAIDWITAKGPGFGQANVYIDNVKQGATIDLYNATSSWKVHISFSGLSGGQHTIEVRPLGTKNVLSSGTAVVVDAFKGPITATSSLVRSGIDNGIGISWWWLAPLGALAAWLARRLT